MIPENNIRKTIRMLTVRESRPLAEGVYSLTLEYPEGAAPETVRPGQFVGVYTGDAARLLPRPISVCGWDAGRRCLRLVYRIVGEGTAQFARLREGENVRVLGVLGNGYDVPALAGKRVLLIGGGIGAPPMLGLAQALQAANGTGAARRPAARSAADDFSIAGRRLSAACAAREEGLITSVMGYRTNDLFLAEEFTRAGELIIATDDGSAGFHGNAVEAARSLMERDQAAASARNADTGYMEAAGGGSLQENVPCPFDVICACGPLPMLRGVKELSHEFGIPAYVSLEERMACGVGACLGCVVRTVQADAHSHVRNARVCTEGPVFNAEEVDL